jgi:hypothetical protein
MGLSTRDFVVGDLLVFFRSRCTNSALIKDENSNVRSLCGYNANLPGWRLLSDPISLLPHIHSYGYWLRPTDMDNLATIGKIADKLISSKSKKSRPQTTQLRTGKAKFIAMGSERADD